MNINVTAHREDSRLIMDQFYNKVTMESIRGGSVFHKVPLTKNMLSIDSNKDYTGAQITVSIHTHSKEELDTLTTFIGDLKNQPEISELAEQNEICFTIVNQDALIAFKSPYFPKFNIDVESSNNNYINITLKEREEYIDIKRMQYKCELNTNGDPSLAQVLDQIKSQFYGRRWGYSIIEEDDCDHIIVRSEKPPIIGFAQSHEILLGAPTEVRCTCSVTCQSDEDAANIGDTIHNQLVGRYEYINNQIILNIDGNMIHIIMSADINVYPIILF